MAPYSHPKHRRRAAGATCVVAALCTVAVPGLLFSFAPFPIPQRNGQNVILSSTGLQTISSEKSSNTWTVTAASAASVFALGFASLKGLGQRASAGTPEKRRCSGARVAREARGGGSAPIVVIAGPPAAGKGTQCEKIKEMFGYVHVSTGDILRTNIKEGTELGLKAKEYIDAGRLVPSEFIVDLVKDRLKSDDVAERGCLLDGFPRTPDQAQALVDAGVKVDKFIVIKVPDETLVERGCGRRLDPETGEIFHMKFKPPPAEIVDRLVHRSDDQEEAIKNRLSIYHEQVEGISPFFKDVLVEIDGTGTPADVFELVKKGLA